MMIAVHEGVIVIAVPVRIIAKYSHFKSDLLKCQLSALSAVTMQCIACILTGVSSNR